MPTIDENLQSIRNIKAGLFTSIEAKGVTMTNVPFTEYAAKIAEIPVGTLDATFYNRLVMATYPPASSGGGDGGSGSGGSGGDSGSGGSGGGGSSGSSLRFVCETPDRGQKEYEYDEGQTWAQWLINGGYNYDEDFYTDNECIYHRSGAIIQLNGNNVGLNDNIIGFAQVLYTLEFYGYAFHGIIFDKMTEGSGVCQFLADTGMTIPEDDTIYPIAYNSLSMNHSNPTDLEFIIDNSTAPMTLRVDNIDPYDRMAFLYAKDGEIYAMRYDYRLSNIGIEGSTGLFATIPLHPGSGNGILLEDDPFYNFFSYSNTGGISEATQPWALVARYSLRG